MPVDLSLLDQFVASVESPSPPPSFLADLQTPMVGCPPLPLPYCHKAVHANLVEDLLLAHFVLVWWDGAQPLLAPLYD